MKKKVVKYITNNGITNETHWSYCKENKIPYIEISEHSAGWSNVSYDLFHCNIPDPSGEKILDVMTGIYQSFQIFLRIPEETALFDGGSRHGKITVRKEHSEFIAENMYDFFVHLETNFNILGDLKNEKYFLDEN